MTSAMARDVTDLHPPDILPKPDDCEQDLLEAFLVCHGRSRGPVIAISERTMITNHSASEMLQPGDRRIIWQWVVDVLHDKGVLGRSLVMRSGLRVTGRCRPVGTDPCRIGAVVQLSISETNR